jgi:hypothetical protein
VGLEAGAPASCPPQTEGTGAPLWEHRSDVQTRLMRVWRLGVRVTFLQRASRGYSDARDGARAVVGEREAEAVVREAAAPVGADSAAGAGVATG